MAFPLATTTPKAAGLRPEPLAALTKMIEKHVAEGTYPGCQIALARNGKLALVRSFGNAVTDPQPREATDSTLWLLYSNTKVICAAAGAADASKKPSTATAAKPMDCVLIACLRW